MSSRVRGRTASGPVFVEEPPLARWLFASSSAAWIWLIARVWLGWESPRP